MKDRIIGRESEKEVLTSLYQSNNAEFLAIYGRRRAGRGLSLADRGRRKD
jgi:AAA+ ATPase superfamily predicted ATPase